MLWRLMRIAVSRKHVLLLPIHGILTLLLSASTDDVCEQRPKPVSVAPAGRSVTTELVSCSVPLTSLPQDLCIRVCFLLTVTPVSFVSSCCSYMPAALLLPAVQCRTLQHC
jgi:hypothetical protein